MLSVELEAFDVFQRNVADFGWRRARWNEASVLTQSRRGTEGRSSHSRDFLRGFVPPCESIPEGTRAGPHT